MSQMRECISVIVKKIPFLKAMRIKRQLAFSGKYLLSREQVQQAEASPEKKKSILQAQMEKWPERTAELQLKIDAILQAGVYSDADIKNLTEDMLFSCFAYGYTPNEYICYNFPAKTLAQRHEFLSDRDSICLGFRLNDINSFGVFSNKFKTYERFQSYYHRDAILIKTAADASDFLHFIEKHRCFVKKLVGEACGRSIERIDLDRENCSPKEMFDRLITDGETIIEECVVQSSKMCSLNASSVNTVRCITMNTKKGVILPYCFLKVGRAGSFIDNGGAGGILVGIDERTGVLCTDGVDELNRRYSTHPDSNVLFQGFRLPQWDEALHICHEIASQIPEMQLIGWDLAHTDDGWIVIEGNALTEVIGPQATFGNGIRGSFEGYMKDMKMMY